MKKKITVVFALVLALAALSGAAFAAGTDAASPDIWAQSWTVDGQCAISCPDGSTQALPEFSELFPGQEVPCTEPMAAPDCETTAMDMETAKNYAYLDLDTAPEELRQKILDARTAIIFSKSWTVDGQCAISCPDGSEIPLPEFSDLFPGWDVPTIGKSTEVEVAATGVNAVPAALFTGTVYLQRPADVGDTSPFYSFRADGHRVNTIARSIPGVSYNVGYTDCTTGRNAGWATYLPLGYGLMAGTISGHTYSVRASTYSTTGNSTMWVRTVVN